VLLVMVVIVGALGVRSGCWWASPFRARSWPASWCCRRSG
jgi:hypothetical protein